MLLLSISTLLLSLIVEASHGHYYGTDDVSNSRPPMCATPSKPCRLRVQMLDADGTEIESIGTGTCACSPPYSCPSDWTTHRRHVVSRRIVSTTYDMTLQMMFCRPVEPKVFCRPGNISLVVKGSMAMPQDSSSYNCRCRRRQPLVLQERSFGLDNLIHHSYACADHVDICSRTASCMIMNHTTTEYPCQCAAGYFCRIPEELWGQETSYGYCRP